MAKPVARKTAIRAAAKRSRTPAGKTAARPPRLKETPAFKKGLAVRRAVLGRKYVAEALARAAEDPFTVELQQYVTETAWGGVWTRPGLDRRGRSLVCLGMLGALDKPRELKLHIRGALNNGLSRDEIKEVLLQVAVYCGAPAALEAFRAAGEVFAEIDAE